VNCIRWASPIRGGDPTPREEPPERPVSDVSKRQVSGTAILLVHGRYEARSCRKFVIRDHDADRRRWDDVFRGICAGLDTGSKVKIHVRQQQRDFVLFGISRGRYAELLREGVKLASDRHNCTWPEFYVDPDDSVLKDRIWFWRVQSDMAPARRNQLLGEGGNDTPNKYPRHPLAKCQKRVSPKSAFDDRMPKRKNIDPAVTPFRHSIIGHTEPGPHCSRPNPAKASGFELSDNPRNVLHIVIGRLP
jgi:hypothetical protein